MTFSLKTSRGLKTLVSFPFIITEDVTVMAQREAKPTNLERKTFLPTSVRSYPSEVSRAASSSLHDKVGEICE
ncbi:hypothetical protein E2C01_023711 [Portunus trituberculatus]|uniref:Uncharacterized protein n=1 Tax=Portunus trituberculatus TaxID=210409 RepID=A0A5B7EAR5_PORTR|nr:hypothetical protein [Portunus trituberculatus]